HAPPRLSRPRSFPTRRSSDLRRQVLAVASGSLLGYTEVDRAHRETECFSEIFRGSEPLESNELGARGLVALVALLHRLQDDHRRDRKSTRLNSSHLGISYAVF